MDSVRVDRWLCAARIYKSRTQATEACNGGHVSVNGIAARPSRLLRTGDVVRALAPRGEVILEVVVIEEKRQSPPRARLLYSDHSPPPAPREERVAIRPRGSGRPTKAERRAMDKLRSE